MSGSPPRRAPPPIDVNRTADNALYSSRQPDPLIVENIEASMDNFSPKYNATTCTPLSQVEDVNIPPLGLPCLNTGIGWFTLNFNSTWKYGCIYMVPQIMK